jgi:hypothetical protein
MITAGAVFWQFLRPSFSAKDVFSWSGFKKAVMSLQFLLAFGDNPDHNTIGTSRIGTLDGSGTT